MEHNDVYVQREAKAILARRLQVDQVPRGKLLKQGMVVVDLGAAPGGDGRGGESQRRRPVVRSTYLPMDALRNVTFCKATSAKAVVEAGDRTGQPSDNLVKRYVPGYRRTGRRARDASELALEFAMAYLETGRQPAGQSVGVRVQSLREMRNTTRSDASPGFARPQQVMLLSRV